MGFFSNRTVNYLNLHISLIALLDQAYFVFVPIYLYKQGFSIAGIFLLLALLNGARIPLRFLALPLVRRLGLKTVTMLGAVGYGCSFGLLSLVEGWDGWLALYILVFSSANALHWLCYHVLYSLAGENEKRGRQVAAAMALSTGLTAAAPALGAFAIVEAGFSSYFLLLTLLIFAMLWALARCRDVAVTLPPWREGRKTGFNLGAKIHLAESAAAYPLYFGWIFLIYLHMGEVMSVGGVVTFGIFMRILYQLLLGALVDRGRGSIIAHVAGSVRLAQVLGKGLAPLSLPAILGLESLSAVSFVHNAATMPVPVYNAGKESPHPFWYWLFAEAAWDIGTVLGAGGAALLLWCGVPLQQVILLAAPPVMMVWWLVWRYFRNQPYVRLPAL